MSAERRAGNFRAYLFVSCLLAGLGVYGYVRISAHFGTIERDRRVQAMLATRDHAEACREASAILRDYPDEEQAQKYLLRLSYGLGQERLLADLRALFDPAQGEPSPELLKERGLRLLAARYWLFRERPERSAELLEALHAETPLGDVDQRRLIRAICAAGDLRRALDLSLALAPRVPGVRLELLDALLARRSPYTRLVAADAALAVYAQANRVGAASRLVELLAERDPQLACLLLRSTLARVSGRQIDEWRAKLAPRVGEPIRASLCDGLEFGVAPPRPQRDLPEDPWGRPFELSPDRLVLHSYGPDGRRSRDDVLLPLWPEPAAGSEDLAPAEESSDAAGGQPTVSPSPTESKPTRDTLRRAEPAAGSDELAPAEESSDAVGGQPAVSPSPTESKPTRDALRRAENAPEPPQ